MQYTQLGSSGLVVSRICLGCMTYGTPKWRPWILDEVDSRPFYKKALDLGINFFDTADMYSMGVSEEVTGRALHDMANMEEIVLATKVHFPMGGGPNMGGISRKHIGQGCEASLRRLGVETIDLYQNSPLQKHGAHRRNACGAPPPGAAGKGPLHRSELRLRVADGAGAKHFRET